RATGDHAQAIVRISGLVPINAVRVRRPQRAQKIFSGSFAFSLSSGGLVSVQADFLTFFFNRPYESSEGRRYKRGFDSLHPLPPSLGTLAKNEGRRVRRSLVRRQTAQTETLRRASQA